MSLVHKEFELTPHIKHSNLSSNLGGFTGKFSHCHSVIQFSSHSVFQIQVISCKLRLSVASSPALIKFVTRIWRLPFAICQHHILKLVEIEQTVLHQDGGGIGKSILDARKISRNPRLDGTGRSGPYIFSRGPLNGTCNFSDGGKRSLKFWRSISGGNVSIKSALGCILSRSCEVCEILHWQCVHRCLTNVARIFGLETITTL